jgi:hypothetical protein
MQDYSSGGKPCPLGTGARLFTYYRETANLTRPLQREPDGANDKLDKIDKIARTERPMTEAEKWHVDRAITMLGALRKHVRRENRAIVENVITHLEGALRVQYNRPMKIRRPLDR